MTKSEKPNAPGRILLVMMPVVIAVCAAFWYFRQYGDFTIDAPYGVPYMESRRGMKPRLDTARQNILLIGDSMAYTLMFRAQNYCTANGHDLNVVSWVSATSRTFALCDTLEYFVNLYKPTYIIFVIGANEMFKADAPSRGMYFDNIRQQCCGVPLVVVGPPNWRQDTGINDVMMEKFGPRQFFLSKRLRYTRIAGDVVHPDRASGSMWMDSISTWIMRDSFFPIRLDRPSGDNPIHVDFVKLVLRDPSLA